MADEIDIIQYNPSITDNFSLLISQRLGDGHFEFHDNRSNLKIEHGYKQYDYLKFKINLLKKAFPTIVGLEGIKKREYKGYISYTWRSNNFRNTYMEKIKTLSKLDLISFLTPLGWMLWYLDDGAMYQHNGSNRLDICIHENDLREKAIAELKTYGLNFSNTDEKILVSDRMEIIKFLNCFIKPFMHLIPECMYYKCIIKI